MAIASSSLLEGSDPPGCKALETGGSTPGREEDVEAGTETDPFPAASLPSMEVEDSELSALAMPNPDSMPLLRASFSYEGAQGLDSTLSGPSATAPSSVST